MTLAGNIVRQLWSCFLFNRPNRNWLPKFSKLKLWKWR